LLVPSGQIKGRLLLSEGQRRRWPRSATACLERLWRTWRQRPSPKRFWVGIGSSSRTNLMGRNSVEV